MSAENTNPARTLADEGTLVFTADQLPLSEQEWRALEMLVDSADYDHVVAGDSSEQHSVHVARFVNDVDIPRSLSPLTADIRRIVMSEKMRRFYRQFAGTPELCLRRCQANRLESGDYIGIHKDQDSNPDYMATAVFHFDDAYEGGEFVTHHGVTSSSYHPRPFSLLVNNCAVPHEVTPVSSGKRKTLACFLSTQFGVSPGKRQAFKLSD